MPKVEQHDLAEYSLSFPVDIQSTGIFMSIPIPQSGQIKRCYACTSSVGGFDDDVTVGFFQDQLELQSGGADALMTLTPANTAITGYTTLIEFDPNHPNNFLREAEDGDRATTLGVLTMIISTGANTILTPHVFVITIRK